MLRRSRHALIDLDSLKKFNHKCDGCAKRAAVASCCSGLEVCVSKSEIVKIIGIIPYIVKYCHHLLVEDKLDNVFNKSEDGLYTIDTHINGLCVFAYRKNSTILCGIHSVADFLGLNWYDLKPLPCILWPLAISDDLSPVISLDDSAGSFHCNTGVKSNSLYLDSSVVQILKNVFDNESADCINRAASKGLPYIKIPLKGILAARL